jgi:hypothetical protein
VGFWGGERLRWHYAASAVFGLGLSFLPLAVGIGIDRPAAKPSNIGLNLLAGLSFISELAWRFL